jgi:hypothetical protein
MLAVLNWPLLSQLRSAVPGNLGDPLLNVWILTWVSRAVLGPADLWHLPVFHPHDNALAFSEPLLGLVPLSVPLLWLTGDPISTYNITFLLLSFLTFFGATLLVRELAGRLDAAVAIGLLVAASPYLMVSQMTRIQMLTCGWSFVALAALHRCLRTGSVRAALVFGTSYTLQALSNTYLGFYLAMPVALLVLHAWTIGGVGRDRKTLLVLACTIAGIAAVLSPLAWMLSTAKDEFGVTRSAAETGAYSATLKSYFSVWHGQQPRWLPAEATADRALFHGAALMVLSAAGLAIAVWRRRWSHAVIAYAGIALVAGTLSLGPQPALWAAPLGIPGPYTVLAGIVPGFDALRSPGRFGLFVLLGMAVAAGCALAAVFARAPFAVRVLALIFCGAIGMTQSTRAFEWIAEVPSPGQGSQAAYAWLAQRPSAPMIELPIVAEYQKHPRASGESLTLFYQLAALDHGHRLVNGSSGFSPPFTAFMEGSASPLASVAQADAALRLLRAIGVRYLVIHSDQYTERAASHAAELVTWLVSATSHVEDHQAFQATHVFVLRAGVVDPVDVGAVTRVAADRMRVTGTANASQIHRLSDGDLSQRWTAPQQIGTRVRIRLDNEAPIAGVTLHLRAHSTGDYPRQVRVVGVRPDGTRIRLFDGPGALELGRQLVESPQEPSVPLWWLPRRLASLDIEIRSNVRAWQWSIHEIDVWEAK